MVVHVGLLSSTLTFGEAAEARMLVTDYRMRRALNRTRMLMALSKRPGCWRL